MPLINFKAELSLTWNEKCILSIAETDVSFTITDAKLYVLVVTLKTEGNAKLSQNYYTKDLKEEFIGMNTK